MSWAVLGALAASAAIAGAYWLGLQAGQAGEEARQAHEERLVAEASAAGATAAAAVINAIEVKHVTVRQQIQREVIERPVFSDCRSGPDAVRLFNSAIPGAAAGPASAGAGQLPAAHAAGR